ncbi:alpha/beta hydrolase fold-3 domain-containing protein [Xylaria nigripes]|nr:alpha/beta hydrolase fold-3 domain-containing protein [Xylaria nigripes]
MSYDDRFPLVAYQPFRLLFQLSYSATVVLRLPYYALRAVIPFLRPHAAWSAKQSFLILVTRPLLDLTSRIGISDPLPLDPGKEGKRWQLVKPSDPSFYQGILASETVKPATIGGTWHPETPGREIASKTVVLYFHGGAYVQGDGRDASCKFIAEKWTAKGGADAVFSLQYRLSGYGGQNPFPAALQDAVSSYLYLLNELKIPADQIIVSGDSAGGNLAIALLRYIADFGAETGIPNPKCAVLLSPWVDPFYLDVSNNPNRSVDFIPMSFARWGATTFSNRWPNPQSEPYITFFGNPFRTPVPIFTNTGSAEILFIGILEWTEQMRKVPGNVIEVNVEEAAPHDTFLVGEILGFEKSAWDVAAKIGKFVAKH